MKKFNGIIESANPPSVYNLWLKDGFLMYFGPNGWEKIKTNGGQDINLENSNIKPCKEIKFDGSVSHTTKELSAVLGELIENMRESGLML